MSNRLTTPAVAFAVVLTTAALVCGLGGAHPAAAAESLVPDEVTLGLLRESEFQQISVSPDGNRLAIARRIGTTTSVTVHERVGLKPLITFDSGNNGVVSELRWLDDQRLLVGATRTSTRDGYAIVDPVMLIATLDGSPPTVLPGDFWRAIPDDHDHILVYDCSSEGKSKDGCEQQILRNTIKKPGKGELLIQGPPGATIYVNPDATTGFALKIDKEDETGRTFVYHPKDKTWSLINDAAVTKLEVQPIGVSRDGSTGFLQSQRKEGPDMIERYDFATGERKPLYADPSSNPLRSVYSMDGLEILGAYYESTSPQLRLWLPDHPDAQVRIDLQAAFPGKYVSIASASKDRNILVLYISSDRDPGAWYLFDRKALKASIITRESPWLDPSKQATMKPFTLKARDGLVLHGLLTIPPGSSGKNLPLVVLPHGGPYWIRDVWGHDPEVQILGQHGYAVLQVNFRGSGGYGWQFIEKGMREWGRAMQDDVTDATRWAIAEGIADPGRICIFGSSYGGYAALMGPIREPGLYKCVAAFAAPTNLETSFKWGSIRSTNLGKKYLNRALGTDKVELAARSPAKHAAEIGVPVLLAHGYRDARVDVRHAHEMKSQLSKRKQKVEYIEYSNTGHGLMLDRHRKDFYARLLRFLDTHIGQRRTTAN